MKTILDNHKEVELESLRYEGNTLVAKVVELVKGERNHIIKGDARYEVIFAQSTAHVLVSEFSACVADIFSGQDTGSLRIIENDGLRGALGLNLKQFEIDNSYALITAHEMLVVFCSSSPVIEKTV